MLLLSRTSVSLAVTSPRLSAINANQAAPASTITLTGEHFSPEPAANDIAITVADGRVFHVHPKHASPTSLDVVVPLVLTADQQAFYTGDLSLGVSTAPGYRSGVAHCTLSPLPQLTAAPGAVIAELAQNLQSLVDDTTPAASAAMSANGVSTADIQYLQTLPRAAVQNLRDLTAAALAGTPRTIDVATPTGVQRIAIDATAIALLERLLIASNAIGRTQAATRRLLAADALLATASCGPTADEARILNAARAWNDIDFAADILTCAEVVAIAIATVEFFTGGTATLALPALLPAIGAIDMIPLAAHIMVGSDYIELQTIDVPRQVHLSVTSPANVPVNGIFQSPLFGDTIKSAVETLVKKALAAVFHIPAKILDLVEQCIEWSLDSIISATGRDVNVPRIFTKSFGLSAATTSFTLESSIASVSGPCNGSLTLTTTQATSRSTSFSINADFPLTTHDGVSNVASGTVVVDAIPRAPIATIDAAAGPATATENGILNTSATAGAQVTVSLSAARSSDPQSQALTFLWRVDGATTDSAKQTAASLKVGSHTISVQVTNTSGISATAALRVIVSSAVALPTAGFTMTSGGSSAVEGQTLRIQTTSAATSVTLSGVRSVDPAGQGLLYSWVVGAVTLSGLDTSTTLPPGTFPVSLTVTDRSQRQASAMATIVITLGQGTAPRLDSVDPSATSQTDFNIALKGSGFDPTTITATVAGPACAPSCTASPGDFLSKSTTTLAFVARAWSPGAYHLSVSNGVVGVPSNVLTLTVGSSNAPPCTLSLQPPTISAESTGGQRQATNVSIACVGSAGARWSLANPSSTGWISPTTFGGDMPGSTSIVLDPSKASIGLNTASLVFSSTAAAGTATLPVTFNVSNAPNSVAVVPLAWQIPYFVGDKAVSLPFKITSSSNSPLTGTISASTMAPWPLAQLTVNGKQDYPWVAPESVTVTADPAGLGAGTYTASLTISAPSASNSPLTIPVTMTIYLPLQIVTTSLPQATAGQPYNGSIVASGGSGGNTWSIESGALPSGLTLGAQDGTISGTPTGQGSSTFTVTVHDSAGHVKSASFTISTQASVGMSDLMPSNLQWIIGNVYTKSGSACFSALGGTPPYTWSATAMPPGLSIDGGCVVGTPTQLGTFNATITVTDATPTHASRQHGFVVSANALRIADGSGNTPPVLTNGTVGATYSSYVQAFGGDPSSYQWSVQGTLPPGISTQNGPGCPSSCALFFAGTPTTANTYTFTVTVKDSLGGSVQQAVTIVVNSGTPPSITTVKLLAATVGSSYGTSLAASGGTGAGYQWSFTNGSPDPGLSLSSAGLLSGTPTLPNDCSGGSSDGVGGVFLPSTFPSKSFQVQVTDSAGQSQTKNLCLVSYYPTPHLTNIVPNTVTVDGSAKSITVNGTNFRPDAYAISTTLQQMASMSVTATTLQFTLAPQFSPLYNGSPGLLDVGAATFKVVQPYSQPSNADQTLTVFAPAPALTSVQAVLTSNGQPCYINVNCQLNVTGSGLYVGTLYKIKETGATLTRGSSASTQVWTLGSTSGFSVTSAGTYTLQITNPNQPGGGTATAEKTFTVNGLNDVTIVPSSWQFGTFIGDPSVSLPFKISSSVGATLTGTVSAGTTAPWPSAQLKVDGLSSYSWVAPETVTVTADSAGLVAGTYSASLTVSAPSATNSPVTIPITMTVYVPLQITTTSLPQAIAGQTYSAALAATGGSGGYTWSLDGGALPSGLSLSTAGAITGTPSGQGTSTFTVGVHDSVGHSKQAALSISTTPSVGMSGISPSNIQWIIGTTYSKGGTGCFSAVGGTPPYTWSATGMPPGLTIDTGCVVGTPSQVGSFNATVKVTDATPTQASTPYTFTVTANPLRVADSSGHTPPALPSGTVGVAYSTYVQAFGGDPSSYQWTVQGTLPPGISTQNGPGCPSSCVLVFTGTPTNTNTYAFNVTVKDSLGGSLQQAITIVINSGTPPSIDTGKMPAATVGGAYSTTLAASGGSGSGYQWSFTNGSPDPGLSLSSGGVLSGTTTLGNDCSGGSSDGIGGGWIDAQHPSKSFQVKVTDSAGQTNTKNLCLVSYFPTPQVTSISPSSITMDGTAKAITVNGASFRSDAYALTANTFNTMATTFVGSASLQFTLNPQFSPYYSSGTGFVNEGVTPFKVIQAWSSASNADKTLTVYAPVPSISSVQAVLGNGQACYINVNCVLNVSGGGFYVGSTYKIKETGATLSRSSAPNTQVWTQVTTSAFSVTTAGTYTLQLTNTNQAGGGSVTVEKTFTVNGL